ncbi:hypothetical protein [Helicobacter pametensis]|uniref:hypothetical protein n=1 Tax=Helicobacter pametensis TaxID=95149 RepID=UPI00048178EB|nr:hypothetical protein [Helicobacter pametensis]
MRRGVGYILIAASLANAQTLFHTQSKIFTYEQNLQRKHIEQMRFDSAYDWRGWGLINSGIRNNFIGETLLAADVLPQIAFDRSYVLSNGELMIGADLNGSGGVLYGGEDEATFGGYGMGVYMLYRTQSDCYLSLGLKFVQIFQNSYDQWLQNIMGLLDVGVGKKFDFGDRYFIETNIHFGMGVISDLHFAFKQNGQNIKLDSQENLPFNFLTTFSIGKQIGKHQVKTSISPKFDFYGLGKIFRETPQGLSTHNPDFHFDLLLSIAYDAQIWEGAHFFTYADFYSLQFEAMIGAGIRVEFGENKYKPLKYPKIKLDKLKKTYLK